MHSEKCVDVTNASLDHDTPVVQADCWGGDNQQWLFKSVPSPLFWQFEITAKHSQKCLDVEYARKEAGTPIIQGDCWGGDNQLWVLNELLHVDNTPIYQIVSRHSGKCLAIANSSFEHAAPLIQTYCF